MSDFFLLLFISAIPFMAMARPRDLSCHALLGSQVLGGSREALRRGGATAGYASQPRRCEGAGSRRGLWGPGDRKMGRSGPIGKQGPIWVRKYLGPGRCRFSWGYFLIEWKYMGDAKEKMANGYPPMVGSLPSRPCPGESFHIISQAISMNVQMVTIVYHCPRKKTYNPSYPTKRGYSTQLYPIYIYSYILLLIPNYIPIISPDHIGGFHAP